MQSCWFAYYTSSNYDILIAVALLDLKVPIRKASYIREWGVYFKRGVNISVNSKTSNLPPGIPQVHVFD